MIVLVLFSDREGQCGGGAATTKEAPGVIGLALKIIRKCCSPAWFFWDSNVVLVTTVHDMG
jgi:hypothetical protein